MVKVKIKYVHCESEEVVKIGYPKRTALLNVKCKNCGKTFQVYCLNNGAKPETKK